MSIFSRKKYWSTPPATILADVAASTSTTPDYAPDVVATLIAACGAPCIPVNTTVGASAVQYHMRLLNLLDYNKLKRQLPAISARLRQNAVLSASPVGDFAITINRAERGVVPFKRTLLTHAFDGIKSPTATVVGADMSGKTVAFDIGKMPHLLIAGATGSGKSVCLHSIIGSMLFKGTPSGLHLLMLDPKQIELTMYNGLPHLAKPVITNVSEAITTLDQACTVMDNRYKQMRKGNTDFPKLVIVIDELADLMLTSKKAVEPMIVRLAQLGRAAGIHLIVATQRPTVNVVTGLIKANMPARIALTMASYRDAGVMEISGADKLAGRGDALFQGPDHTVPPVRFQGAYVSPDDISAIVQYWRQGPKK